MILAFTLSAILSLQPAAAVCDSIGNDEVAALIGAVKSKQPLIDANTCVWNGDRVTFSIMRTLGVEPDAAAPLLDSIKTRARKGDVVADEPGIGSRAVSEVMARGTSISILAVAGTTMWTIRVEHVYSGLKADELLPKLRTIAKKVVTP
jgi:hypothetical protein